MNGKFLWNTCGVWHNLGVWWWQSNKIPPQQIQWLMDTWLKISKGPHMFSWLWSLNSVLMEKDLLFWVGQIFNMATDLACFSFSLSNAFMPSLSVGKAFALYIWVISQYILDTNPWCCTCTILSVEASWQLTWCYVNPVSASWSTHPLHVLATQCMLLNKWMSELMN